ncbi:hypothetical protein ScPMuIL_010264 [Solemya velum]
MDGSSPTSDMDFIEEPIDKTPDPSFTVVTRKRHFSDTGEDIHESNRVQTIETPCRVVLKHIPPSRPLGQLNSITEQKELSVCRVVVSSKRDVYFSRAFQGVGVLRMRKTLKRPPLLNRSHSKNPEESLLSIIQFVEEQTRIDRGRGKKTESVIQVKEDVPDDEVEKELRCGKLAPPRLVIFKSEGCIKGQYVVADGTYINVNSCSEKAGVLLLVAVYYILDLEYPRVYSQLLGILQTHLVDIQPYTGIKSVRDNTYMTTSAMERGSTTWEETVAPSTTTHASNASPLNDSSSVSSSSHITDKDTDDDEDVVVEWFGNRA